jgi:hypothetical protein
VLALKSAEHRLVRRGLLEVERERGDLTHGRARALWGRSADVHRGYIDEFTSGYLGGSARSLPLSLRGGDLKLRNEPTLRSEPISFLRLEGLSLAGERGCASEYVEDTNVLVEPKSSRSGVSFSFSLYMQLDYQYQLFVNSRRPLTRNSLHHKTG